MTFRRDRLTWTAYGLLAWFTYLQAGAGLVVAYLRDELGMGYATGGLHVAALAAGSALAGASAGAIERVVGRRALLWCSAAILALGAVGLVAGQSAPQTIGAALVIGTAGGMLLVTIPAVLADHHGEWRAVALTEANLASGVAYLVLIGALALATATHLGWRVAIVASLALPLIAFARARDVHFATPARSAGVTGRLPRLFWAAAGMLFCAAAAEWCITAWGASFVAGAADVSTEAGVTLMIGYFGGVVAGRALGSRLTRTHDPRRLFALALALTAVGFAVLWPSTAPASALAGLTLLGLGIGNLFPLALSVAVALAPEHAQLASGRAIVTTSVAVLIVPLTLGALADATSLTAAMAIVPLMLALAAAGVTVLRVYSSAPAGAR